MNSSDITRVEDALHNLVEMAEKECETHVDTTAAGHAACWGMVIGALSASGHSLEVAKSALDELGEAG